MIIRLLSALRRKPSRRHAIAVPNTLEGYFELGIDRIFGWVGTRYGPGPFGVRVKILLRGKLIGTAAVEREDNSTRAKFSFPIKNRFSAKELLNEQVTLLAEDGEGNSGRIALDGAAQLELIREFMGRPSTVVFDMDFGDRGNARPFLRSGWSGTEANWTWSEGTESKIVFPRPSQTGRYALQFTAGCFLYQPHISSQEITVSIDGAFLARDVRRRSEPQFFECQFNSDVFSDEIETTLTLGHSDVRDPAEFGGPDDRRLAFCFRRLTLRLIQDLDNA
jgi:hypothetical protein